MRPTTRQMFNEAFPWKHCVLVDGIRSTRVGLDDVPNDDDSEATGWLGSRDAAIVRFAESEVGRALESRGADPMLPEAERWLRDPPSPLASVIAGEVDRLRAEVARLKDLTRRLERAGSLTGGTGYDE